MKNNNTIGYNLHGNGSIKVIALHSWMDDAESWKSTIPFLNEKKYTYAFMDVRGYGKSKSILGTYNLEEIKNDIFQLADSLGFANFNLIGHSMCGMAAQYTAIEDSKDRIDKVILISPVSSSGFPADEQTKEFLNSIVQNVEVAKMGYGAFTSNKYSDHWYTLRAERHVNVTDRNAQLSYMKMWLEENFSDRVSTITKPILVVSGKDDHPLFKLDVQKKNFASFQNVNYKELQDSGHFSMQESPVHLASTIESFF